MDVANVESSIEQIEQEVETAVEQKVALDEKGVYLQQAISQLQEDMELSQLVSKNAQENAAQLQQAESELAQYRDRVNELETELMAYIDQTMNSAQVLESLSALGEEIGAGLALLQERQQLIHECTERLSEVMEKLGMGGTSAMSDVGIASAGAAAEQEAQKQEAEAAEALQKAAATGEAAKAMVDANVRQTGKAWSDALSQSEATAVHAYTGTAYNNINAVLRGKAGTFNEGNREIASNIHSALSRSCIPEDCTVYRGASREALGAYQNLPDEALVGKLIGDKGFMSTSLNPGDAFGGEVRLEISVPAGAKGAYVGYISQCQHYESEVLFDRGQMMRITGVYYNEFGKRIIRAEMLKK